MSPRAQKLALTAHVTASVGWLGAVVVFLALALLAVTTPDVALMRASYLAMEWAGWSVLVPFSVASLLTGLVQSLGSPWGLLRHYWVVIKLVLNVVATAVLLLYTETLALLGSTAAGEPSAGDLALLRSPSVVIHAVAALVVLLVATVLAVYKPRGMTRHGRRQRARQRTHQRTQQTAPTRG